MKKQFFLLIILLFSICLTGYGEQIKLVPSATDSTRMDTIVVSTLQDADCDEADMTMDFPWDTSNMVWEFGMNFAAIIHLIVCGLPLFIVAIFLWFRYKSRQARYKLISEALAAGREIPRELINTPKTPKETILNKGIREIFLGIGLGVFLWILTGSYKEAAIGFLIFCIGVGHVVIAYATSPKHNSSMNDDHK